VTSGEKLAIVYKYVIKNVAAANLAKEYRITPQYVSLLVKKANKNPKMFEELEDIEENENALKDSVKAAITEYCKAGAFLSSINDIQARLHTDHGIDIKGWKLLHILHKDIGMKYKRVSHTSWQGNSPRNLILRQQFALNFLKLDLNKKTVINCDESWIGMTDFR